MSYNINDKYYFFFSVGTTTEPIFDKTAVKPPSDLFLNFSCQSEDRNAQLFYFPSRKMKSNPRDNNKKCLRLKKQVTTGKKKEKY